MSTTAPPIAQQSMPKPPKEEWWQDFDPELLTTEELQQYIDWTINLFKYWHSLSSKPSTMRDLFVSQYEKWTVVTFQTAGKAPILILRNYLRETGVYIKKEPRYSIAQALFDAVNGVTSDEWPADDLEKPQNQGSTQPKAESLDIENGVVDPDDAQPSKFEELEQQLFDTVPHPRPVSTALLDAARISTQDLLRETQIMMRNQADYSKQVTAIARIYTRDADKYSGDIRDCFDSKYRIYINYASIAGLPIKALVIAMPTMLTDIALDFYYTAVKGRTNSIEFAIDKFKQRFETEERVRLLVREWNAASIQSVIQKNSNKSLLDCLNILVKDLTALQACLPRALQQPYFLRDQLLKACDLPMFEVARLKPAETLIGVVGDLQTAIQAKAQNNGTAGAIHYYTDQDQRADSFYTDRQYHQKGGATRKYHFGESSQTARSADRRGEQPGAAPVQGVCWVCGKQGCISYNHTDFDRMKAKTRLDRRQQQLGRHHLRARQFISQIEQEMAEPPAENDDEFNNESFILDSLSEETDDKPIEKANAYTVSITATTIDDAHAGQLMTALSDRSLTHAISHHKIYEHPTTYTLESSQLGLYGEGAPFIGVLIDTGAATFSTAGKNQFESYCRTFSLSPKKELNTAEAGGMVACFGIGSCGSIGTVIVQLPMGEVVFHVVDAATPFLLSMADMDRLKIFFNNITNQLIKLDPCQIDKTPAAKYPIIRQFGHPFLVWGVCIASFLTETELRRLHRRFGHPSSHRLIRLMERAGHKDPQNRQVLQSIERLCHQCQKYGQSPRRFRFTLRNDDVRFNYTVLVDIMYIDGSPVLHVVDEATAFQAARFLSSMTAEAVWESFRGCWIDTYNGPPEICVHDAGSNFRAIEFQDSCHSFGIKTKCVPVEAPQSIGKLERYHGPLRRAFEVFRDDLKGLGAPVHKSTILQMAVKAVNDTAGPDGIVPTLLVFGAYPRLTTESPSPTIAERARTIRRAMQEVGQLHARRQVQEAISRRNGPDPEPVHNVPIGGEVLLWRTHLNSWQGPYKLLSQDGETCVLDLQSGPTPFRSTAVKPYHSNLQIEFDQAKSRPNQNMPAQPRRSNRAKIPTRRALEAESFLTKAATMEELDAGLFEKAQNKEIRGLIENGVFDIVDETSVPNDVRIFKSRFVNEWKAWGTEDVYAKARWVVQAYNDFDKNTVLTQAPTVQRVSCRLLLCIALSLDLMVCSRDISQAYTQSLTKVARKIFIYPPKGLGLAKGQILKVIRPLYGIPEAGTHWVNTYLAYHRDQLHMDQSTFDACLLGYNGAGSAGSEAKGFIGVQVDDTLIVADGEFLEMEEAEIQKANFLSNPLAQLTEDSPLCFNGLRISIVKNIITISQEQQVKRLQVLSFPKVDPSKLGDQTRKEYVAQRARGAYIATSCQPERSFDYAYAAQFPEPSLDEIKNLNAALEWQIRNKSRGLRYIKLDAKTLRVIVFTDSSFANNEDMSSQIGYVVVIADNSGGANVIDWKSIKCRRVTRSVLAAELYGLALGFDIGVAIKSTIDRFLRADSTPLVLATDSQSLYDCLTKLGTTREKRLMVDIMSLREGYERRIISEIWRINGNENPADSMTKQKPNGSLTRLLDSNKLDVDVMNWITRTDRETS